MRRKLWISALIILVVIVVVMLSACDSTLRYTKIEITQMPQKLVYSANDSQLDLSGGIAVLTTAEGKTYEVSLCDFPFADEGEHGVYCDIDFAVPGTYTVVVTQCEGVACTFTVTVA